MDIFLDQFFNIEIMRKSLPLLFKGLWMSTLR